MFRGILKVSYKRAFSVKYTIFGELYYFFGNFRGFLGGNL
jgi:hypothetical protein